MAMTHPKPKAIRNNRLGGIILKRIERIFLALLAAALIAVMLPVSAAAAQKQVEDFDGDDFIIRGTPSPTLPLGTYRIQVVNGTGNSTAHYLKIHYPSNSNKTPVTLDEALNDDRESVTWSDSGLTISRDSSSNSWNPNDTGFFNIIDNSGSTTTVTSSNVKLIDFAKRDIDRGTQISPTFEVVDYNIENARGVVAGSPTMTGFSSNESFVLNGEESISVVSDPASGKVTFRIRIPLRYTGEGNSLSFTIAYKTLDGAERLLDCTTTIPYTIEKNEEYLYDDDEEDFIPDDTPIPYIIVDSYDYGASSVTAGEDFELTLRLRNTSADHSLENIVMSVSPMGVFSMASSSNTFYINRLMAGSIIEKKISINTGLTKVTDDEDANSINIKFTYQYGIRENDVLKLKSGDSSESITLPVNFPDRFELGVPEYNSRVFAGEEMYLTVPMVNKGRSNVYNLSASVRGDMANPGQTQYIGNLNAGTESSADFTLIFDEPGTHTGEVIVTYEDTNMNPKEISTTFSINVQQMDMGMPEPEMPIMPMEPAEPVDAVPENDKTKPIKIVLALLVGSMSAYTTVAKAKAKRSIYLDEDI